ncbi:MAG TPA: long-chain-acyl-CoA synthetase, partial [Steroidobacteraceae bacterium]|nr:long-chain-acyl-CoA synthetase [Steroidobacteraceae bacterium]
FARDAWIRALARTADIEQDLERTLPVLVDRQALELGSAPALISSDRRLSFRELASRSRQYARFGLTRGLAAGDVAALLMPNCAEYAAVWLGLSRIGVTVALLNTHLSGDALAHSIEIVAPSLIVVGAELAPTLAALRTRLERGSRSRRSLSIWVYGASAQDFQPLEPMLTRTSPDALSSADYPAPTLDATALYIYTSGTTGLPKAATVTHYRLLRWSEWFAGLLDAGPADRMYNCLPLYHSVGGVVAIGAMLVGGGAVVIRPRFSASDFWRDVRDERCTLFQYIGELCRYLVNSPRQPRETEHSLRLACGNGLRPEVWETFRTRFRIPRILEYYASTEGNFSLYNCEGQPGAIGRIPPFLAHRLPVTLLRFDHDSGEPLRNALGFCERCGVDEAGEAVGLIPDGENARAGRFEGYADVEASERKILRNVFKPGDAWYRTGDLMRHDAAGFYYFVDRIGETYRWKGENVSTAEVLTALTAIPGVQEGVVFGVTVPHADGRAGMAALVVASEFDLAAFHARVAERLPAYARPVFVRILPALESTGTFKPRKQDLLRLGFDPALAHSPLYFDDPRKDAYVPLDPTIYAAITEGRIRL